MIEQHSDPCPSAGQRMATGGRLGGAGRMRRRGGTSRRSSAASPPCPRSRPGTSCRPARRTWRPPSRCPLRCMCSRHAAGCVQAWVHLYTAPAALLLLQCTLSDRAPAHNPAAIHKLRLAGDLQRVQMLSDSGLQALPGKPAPLSPAQSSQMLGWQSPPPPEQPSFVAAVPEDQGSLYRVSVQCLSGWHACAGRLLPTAARSNLRCQRRALLVHAWTLLPWQERCAHRQPRQGGTAWGAAHRGPRTCRAADARCPADADAVPACSGCGARRGSTATTSTTW